jgi:hypothetical protein
LKSYLVIATCQLRQVIFCPQERSSAFASSAILDMEALHNIRRSPHYFSVADNAYPGRSWGKPSSSSATVHSRPPAICPSNPICSAICTIDRTSNLVTEGREYQSILQTIRARESFLILRSAFAHDCQNQLCSNGSASILTTLFFGRLAYALELRR